MIDVTLPVPTSANDLHKRSSGRVHRSHEYAAWLKEAGWLIAIKRLIPIAGKYDLTILLAEKDPADIDNRAKAASDLLQRQRLIQNDRLARRVVIERSPEVDPGFCRLIVEPV